jgi:hypothetical protein
MTDRNAPRVEQAIRRRDRDRTYPQRRCELTNRRELLVAVDGAGALLD